VDADNGTIQILVEHLAVEKQQGSEGSILRGGGNVLFNCQMGEESFDLGTAPIVWMLQVVEKDVAFDPADVGLLPSASSGHAVRME